MAWEQRNNPRGQRGNDRGQRGNDRQQNDRTFRRTRRKQCRFCLEKVKLIDYKNIEGLRNFTTDRGKILPRRVSGNCAKHQRHVTNAIMRARNIALLPFNTQH